MNDVFTLRQIADWQLKREEALVDLPSLQRGFVWKTKQIEDLWDSLLRGYPIGSFLFSRSGERLHLMDGQQRATSIFLGYFNPYDASDASKAWSIKGELPVVWIDIKPHAKPHTSKYLIRVTTSSHPWGYQAINNEAVLSISDRREALNLFRKHPSNKDGYTSFSNLTVFPYDTSCPVPLSILFASTNANEALKKIGKYLPDYFSTKRGGFKTKEAFLNLLEGDLRCELVDIFETVRRVDKIKIKSNIIDDRVLNEETEAEDPTLFVRINSSGTKLTGDDLIYSIYKAIFPGVRSVIENIRMTFIHPTQILSFISRLAASDLDENKYIKKMNVMDFQRKIKNGEYAKKLKDMIETEEMEKSFSLAIDILLCNNNPLLPGGVPPIIIKQFIKRNQDLFLFFVQWLRVNPMDITNEIKLKMVGKLLLFAWFDFGNIQRLWDAKIEDNDFWSEPLNELIWWGDADGIHFIMDPDLLREYYSQPHVENRFIKNGEDRWSLLDEGVGKIIKQYYDSVKSLKFDPQTANRYFCGFIESMMRNKQLILFAQRDYINLTFGDYNQMDDVDDTNVPWDWDHIYPNSWVYNMKNCMQIIRDWNGTNGNFRAISLEQNRSESNAVSPSIRFEDPNIRDYSFVLKNDWMHWSKITERIWDEKNAINHYRAITTRMVNIYAKFWNDLKIQELFR